MWIVIASLALLYGWICGFICYFWYDKHACLENLGITDLGQVPRKAIMVAKHKSVFKAFSTNCPMPPEGLLQCTHPPSECKEVPCASLD